MKKPNVTDLILACTAKRYSDVNLKDYPWRRSAEAVFPLLETVPLSRQNLPELDFELRFSFARPDQKT